MTNKSSETKVTYWVMANVTSQLQAGGEVTRNGHHFGTDDLETAKKSVRELRDYASKGKGLHFGSVINSAWIEIERRSTYPF